MRSFNDIVADIRKAATQNDASALRILATEMRTLPDSRAIPAADNADGDASRLVGEMDAAMAFHAKALEAYSQLADVGGLIVTDLQLGNVYYSMGDHQQALTSYLRALDRRSPATRHDIVAALEIGIGNVHSTTGELERALQHFFRALALSEEHDDLYGVTRAITNIALVHDNTGDHVKALEWYMRALDIDTTLNNKPGIANVLGNMGVTYSAAGDPQRALSYYRQALELYTQLGSIRYAGIMLSNIGDELKILEQYDEAMDHFQRARAIAEETHDHDGIAITTSGVIDCLLRTGRIDEASALLDQLATMELADPRIRGGLHAYKGRVHVKRNEFDEASKEFEQALEIVSAVGLRTLMIEAHGNLRDLAQQRNDFAAYILHNTEHQRITEEVRGRDATQRITMLEAERAMEGERRAREKERAVLYSTLPKHIADRVIRGEQSTGDHFEYASVLFADIVGFTTHTATMPTQNVVELLEQIFASFDLICQQHGVLKIKTIGDSYLCFKGDGTREENASAIAIVASTMNRNVFTWPHEGSPVQFRIGIHIGPVTAGIIGTERLQYDVWGDTVNTASRMESTSEPGKIHVSEALANALGEHKNSLPDPLSHASLERGRHTVIPRGTVDVKGKGMMRTYWLE